MQEAVSALSLYGYDFVKVLYIGRSSHIYLIRCQQYHQKYVCKVSIEGSKDTNVTESYKREVEALLALDHPNIIRILDAFRRGNLLFIITEYCPNGSLQSYLAANQKLHDAQLLQYTKEIISALSYIHSRGLSHGNIHPSNILLDENGKIKLCDFGASFGTHTVEIRQDLIVKYFSAPEMTTSMIYDPMKADMWSLGVTLYSIASGKNIISAKNLDFCIHEVRNGRDHLVYISRTMRNIINSCLSTKPSDRPNVYEIKKMLDSSHISARPVKNFNESPSVLSSSGKTSLKDVSMAARRNRNSYSGN